MRTFLLSLVAACWVLEAPGHTLAQDDVRALVDRAIQAHGGEVRLAYYRAEQSQSKGVLHALQGDTPFTKEVLLQLPGQIREVLEFETMGRKYSLITVVNGEKGWISINGQTQEANAKLLGEQKEAAHLLRISRLLALKDRTMQLSALKEIQVDGQAALGVKVACKGYRDIHLYFARATGLLVKIERRTVNFMNGKEVAEERIISAFQDCDGLKVGKKIAVFHDGKHVMDAEATAIKFLPKIDERAFGKP